jgi:hypothetical protein
VAAGEIIEATERTHVSGLDRFEVARPRGRLQNSCLQSRRVKYATKPLHLPVKENGSGSPHCDIVPSFVPFQVSRSLRN